MWVNSNPSSPPRPDVPRLLSRARIIAEIARARARETEANRRISDDLIESMHDAELFRILQPEAYGGVVGRFVLFSCSPPPSHTRGPRCPRAAGPVPATSRVRPALPHKHADAARV